MLVAKIDNHPGVAIAPGPEIVESVPGTWRHSRAFGPTGIVVVAADINSSFRVVYATEAIDLVALAALDPDAIYGVTVSLEIIDVRAGGAVEEDATTLSSSVEPSTIVFLPCTSSPYFQSSRFELASMNAPFEIFRTSIPAPVEVPDPGPVIACSFVFRMTLLA
jgi:hypothetical protein